LKLRGLFIKIMRGLKALEIQGKLKLSLLVQVEIENSIQVGKWFQIRPDLCYFITRWFWHSKHPNWKMLFLTYLLTLLLYFQRNQFHCNPRSEQKVMIKKLRRVENPNLNPIRFWLLLEKFWFNPSLDLIKLNRIF